VSNLAAWFIAMVGPTVARVLASLGLTVITLTGLTVAFDALKAQVVTGVASLPATALQLGGLFGLWEGLGIELGALAFCITWQSTKGFWSFAKA
jgi:hypothetical protein